MSDIVTLTTDFGLGSPYVAELKGAVLSIRPQAVIVDVVHTIAPQDVVEGAMALRQVASAFPPRTVHVAVVDPGVGSDRSILLAEVCGAYYVAPDNGLLSLVLEDASTSKLYQIDKPDTWRHPVSATFHGRDIMAPVAARLAAGDQPDALASPLRRGPVLLDFPRAQIDDRVVEGEITMVDSFGNLLTNIRSDHIERGSMPDLRIIVDRRELPVVRTYSDALPGEVVGLVGSGGWLEIAVVGGNAAQKLGGKRGQAVRVTW